MIRRLIRTGLIALAAYGGRMLYQRFATPMRGAALDPVERSARSQHDTRDPALV
jgi:hypothetical protein